MKYSGINGLDSFFKKSLLGFLHIPSCDTSRTQTFFLGGWGLSGSPDWFCALCLN